MMISKVNIDLYNLYDSSGFNQWGFLFYCVSINLILRLYCWAMLLDREVKKPKTIFNFKWSEKT